MMATTPIQSVMPLTVPALGSLDAASVRNNHALLAQLVQELNPAVDVKQGPIYNLLLYLSAILTTADQVIADQVFKSASLAAINADPTLATDTVVDNLLSNYRITRVEGRSAAGQLRIILNSLVVVTIQAGSLWAGGGRTFVADAAYTSRTSQLAILTDSDRLITALGNGTYGFTIGVVDSAVGVAGNIVRGTQLTPPTAPSLNFVQAITQSDFTGGTDTETNAGLMTRLASGAGLKAWSNRMTVDALLHNVGPSNPTFVDGTTTALDFTNILGTSIIGFGDVEMVRDQHSLWPGSMGGRADLYVRTQERVGSALLLKSAVLVTKVGGDGIWQFSLGRDEVPGFYAVTKITQAGEINSEGAGYAVQDDVRGYDVTGVSAVVPDVTDAEEALFSRYQTTTIRFLDTDTDTALLTENVTTRAYDVTLSYMPSVGQIQDFIKTRAVATPDGDVLVKAPFPVIVGVSFTVELRSGQATPDLGAIRNAVATVVNRTPFGNQLYAAAISAAVSPYLPTGASISGLNMTGVVRYQDNTTESIASSDVLAPTIHAERPMTSTRTVAYFLNPADVTVAVVTVTSPNV